MKKLSVLIGCYGDFPEYSLRALRSVMCQSDFRQHCDVHVGANECCQSTLGTLREAADGGLIETLIESRRNLNKDPMMRLLIAVTSTPYLLWMDDDSWLKPGWLPAFESFLEENADVDVAGSICISWRWPGYDAFMRRRPWWRGEEKIPESQKDIVVFPTGGMILARTAFLRQHNFPDRGIVKRNEDMLLGDLVNQSGARMIGFSEAIMQQVAINDGERRGDGEGEDGWRHDEDAQTEL